MFTNKCQTSMYAMWQARPAQEKPLSGRGWMQVKGACPTCRQSTSFRPGGRTLNLGDVAHSSKIVALCIVQYFWMIKSLGAWKIQFCDPPVWAKSRPLGFRCTVMWRDHTGASVGAMSTNLHPGVRAVSGENKVKATLQCCPWNRPWGLGRCRKCH